MSESPRAWGEQPTRRVPGWVDSDPAIYREELERFFDRGHWCYVGLACEVPEPGDFLIDNSLIHPV